MARVLLGGVADATDRDIKHLCSRLPSLEALGIGGMVGLTDFSLGHIGELVGARLTSLNAHGVRGFTKEGLEGLLESCPGLRSVDLKGCDNRELLTRAFVRQLNARFPYDWAAGDGFESDDDENDDNGGGGRGGGDSGPQ